MHLSSTLVASTLAIGASAAGSNYLGFNSGATFPDRSAKFKKDFEAEFKSAQGLDGAPGKFDSVRLYTNIQAYSKDDPIEAFEAAIDTKTNLLLGVWASGVDDIDKEINALKKAVSKYGSKLTDLVIGISIGSEDLYRDSQTGAKNDAGIGNSPDNIIKFIKDYKKAFADNPLSNVPVGHVDTWDAWTNSSIKSVIDEVDWLGVDEYPFYESGKGNKIENSGKLFDRAYEATIGAANGKPVWVTETGWPVTGEDWDEAKPSVKNAKYYWNEIGCRQLFGKTPTFWYTLRDSNPDNKVKFAISKDLSTKPLFDLSCPTTFETKNETSSSASASGTATGSATGTGASKPTSTGSGSGSGSNGGGSGSSGTGSGSGDSGSSGSGTSDSEASGTTTGAQPSKTGAAATVGQISGVFSVVVAVVAAAALL